MLSRKSNKKSGTEFETVFRKILRGNGFWSHKLVENENGAPFDIIAIKNGQAYAFDCKECSSDRFPLSRVEDNQITGMRKIQEAGARAYFVFSYQNEMYVALANHIFSLIKSGEKSTKVIDYRPLKEWLPCH